jgi:hypothetical protein
MKKFLAFILFLSLSADALAGGYVGDYAPGDTVDCKFGTVQPSTGASFTLGGTPVVSAYKDNSTTQSTTGITLTADFDGVTGANHIRVTTASDGAFYSAGSFFELMITTGTVDSVSVVGQVPCSFSLNKTSALRPTVAGRTADVSTGGNVGIDLDNVTVTNGCPTCGFSASGTLTGTPTATTADLGTNAPGAASDMVGKTLVVPGKFFSRTITAYDTGTGIATFSSTTVSLASGDAWYLWETAPGSSTLTAGEIWMYSDRQLTALDEDVTAMDLNATSVGSAANVAGSVGSVVGNVGGTINGLTATAQGDVRTSVGLATANLDTQLTTIDTIVDTIVAKTNQLTFTVAGEVDSNATSMNDSAICGTGDPGNEWTGCP